MTPAETVSRWAMFLDKPIEVEDAIAALVKAERERAAIPDDDGWIEWHGGECPVVPNTLIDIRLRCGIVTNMAIAAACYWSHKNFANDIIAYRVLLSNEQV